MGLTDGLLERDGDLADLEALLDEARDGSGAVALVHGEAGIGKTSLVRAFVERHVDDAFVLTGGCDDLRTPRPLGPVWDMAYDDPSLFDALRHDDRHQLFHRVLELVSRSLRPTIVVIEDVHWADEASLDLVTFLGRRIERTHALLVLTFRDEPANADGLAGLLADLPHDRRIHVPLRPLTLEAVRALAGDELDPRSIWEVSGGNPFLATELAAVGNSGVPASVLDVARARVSALSDVGRDLVELAAVVPRRVDVVLVDAIDPSLRSGTAEAERTGLLEIDGDEVAFRHELVREAIEGGLSGTRRTALNLAVLAALEKLDADLSRQAHHVVEANDHAAMVRILPGAAKSAIDVGSHREAVSLLRVLAPHVEQMALDEQADFYDLLAEEEHMVSGGGDDAIRRCIDIRRGLDDPKKLGRSLLFAGFLAQNANDPRAAAEWIDQGMAVLGPVGGDDLAMAHAQAARLAILRSDLEQALLHADEALVHADDLGAARAGALITMGMARATVAYPDGIDLLEEGHRIAEASHALIESARAALIVSGVALNWRDSVTAQRWIRWAVDRAETFGVSTLERAINVPRAELEVVRGNLDEAEQFVRSVIDDPRTIENTRTWARIHLATVLIRTGRGEIESALGRAWESAGSTGDPAAILSAAAVIAEHRWLGGTVAAGTVEEMMSEFRQRPATAEPWHVGDLALRLWLNGDIAAMPDDVPDVLSRLGRGDWSMAARWFAERDAPYDEAIALSLGDDAARLRALEILEDVGAEPFAAKLRADLRARGVAVPGRRAHATRDHKFGLTQRQSEVLELVRDGLSNADIGRRLFISERTVEHHVSAILTKLDVTTRAEAVDKTHGD